MRSELVFTHFTCNQNCTYCSTRRPSDELSFIRGAAVRARIDEALQGGAAEVVLTGGEPAMRADLVELVAHARARGAVAVTLETNAALVDAPRAASLARAGLGLARVNLSGWGDALDQVTRDPGGFRRTVAGLEALGEAGIAVEVVAALVRGTRPLLAALPQGLGALAHRPRGLLLRVPTTSPNPEELLSYEEAAPLLVELAAAARSVGLPVKLAPDSGPPPCVLPARARIEHLFSLTPGSRRRDDHVQLEPCARCRIADRCSGLPRAYLDRHPAPAMRPVADDRSRRRLSLISTVEEQVAREFVQANRAQLPGQPVVEERLIRVNFHCNQSCRFCFVSTHLPPPGDEAVRRAIVEAGEAGAKVVLTGGEPTLNPRLVEYVRLAKETSPHPVNLQTNAIRLADGRLVRELVDAGLAEAFVSLHGATAAIADAVTEAPGTFEKTILGLDQLHAAGVMIAINFVICERNYAELLAFVRLVAGRWPRALVNLSFVAASTDVVPKERSLVPRYSDVLPALAEALGEARRLNVTTVGFESMCGLPLCLVPAEIEPYLSLTDLPEGLDRGEFMHPAACETCDLNRKCHGLRRSYFELYGADDLRPVEAIERTA